MEDRMFIRSSIDDSIAFSINSFRIVIFRRYTEVYYRPYDTPRTMYGRYIFLSRTGQRIRNMLRYYRVDPECCLVLADKGRIYRR